MTRTPFDPTVSTQTALAFRARANTLIPVLDALNRQCALPDSAFQGVAATAYRARQRVVSDAVVALIDAYNRTASALEQLSPNDMSMTRYKVGTALASLKALEERLTKLLARPLPLTSPTLAPVVVIQNIAVTRTPREVLTYRIPSRAAQNGVPKGFKASQFRALLASSIAQAPSDAAAAALLWGSKNLGFPYSLKKRQRPGFFDCSSFVVGSIESAGQTASIDGVAADTSTLLGSFTGPDKPLVAISPSDAKPGDLLFYSTQLGRGAAPVQHVVLVLADGYIMHAPSSGSVTRIEKMDLTQTPFAARRIRSN